MNKTFIAVAIFFLLAASAVSAHADLNNVLADLNLRAKTDITSFNLKLSTQFGIPLPKVRTVIKEVASPADAFMCFQLSLMSNRSPERVLEAYRNNKGKGWGVIAKELGIKPGSAEFHALKRGNFKLTGDQGKITGKGQGKDKGKGQGQGRKK